MKNPVCLLSFICFIVAFHSLQSQELLATTDGMPSDFLERNPIYDHSEMPLNATDSIPDFETKTDKLILTGTIYQSDGVTPAKDVILYISQPDEDGDYVMKKDHGKRYVYHRAWVKTDADGKYTLYTFIPGNFWQNREVKHIHPTIKEPGKQERELPALLFDNDPFLSKACKKRMAKRGIDNILKPEKKETAYVATKDFILEAGS